MQTIDYRYAPGDRVAYVGARKRLRGKIGRIDGPHIPSGPQLARMEQLGIRRRESYDITWDDDTQETVLAGCLRRPTELRNTLQLKEGDIVDNQGMRILLDGRIPTYQEGVVAFSGLVLNADELCDKDSPRYDAYIARHLRGIWWEDTVPRRRKDDWTIQGNHRAMWHVEMR